MRGAACRVIEALALGGVPLGGKAVARLMDTVDEGLRRPPDRNSAEEATGIRLKFDGDSTEIRPKFD